MIVADLTEVNSQTRIPADLIAIATICEGLERETGADLLISPSQGPPLTSLSGELGKLLLKKHLESGAILVQRKSGPDIVNFIKDHDQILAKMLKWTQTPWLLTTGAYFCDSDDKLIVEGRRVGGDTGWSYWSYWGALRAWQQRGGYVDNIARDSLLLDWYNRVMLALNNTEEVVYAMPRKPSQRLVVDDIYDKDMYERAACITALATIDGVGIAKAAAIANYSGNLAHSLVFLSDPANIKYKDNTENYPKGVGSRIFANTNRWLGLKTGGIGKDQWYERLLIDTVYLQEQESE